MPVCVAMFSKYETYSYTNSLYFYKDSNVFINKFNIKSIDELKTVEEEITSVKQYVMLAEPIKGRFTKTHLCNIHKFLFNDIYPFAGKIRVEQIGKADTWFYPPDLIDIELEKVFNHIKLNNAYKGYTKEDFFDRLAYVMAELNIIHPFREGNGRAIREFIRCLALHNGYDLNWGNIDKEILLQKSIQSVDNYEILLPVLIDCIDK